SPAEIPSLGHPFATIRRNSDLGTAGTSSMTLVREHDWAPPSRADAVLFQLKVLVFRLERLARDALRGPRRLPRAEVEDFPHSIALSRAPLWAEVGASERALQR